MSGVDRSWRLVDLFVLMIVHLHCMSKGAPRVLSTTSGA